MHQVNGFDHWSNNINSENAIGAQWIYENCDGFYFCRQWYAFLVAKEEMLNDSLNKLQIG